MTVFNFGSINVDLVYAVPHMPEPGETLMSTAHTTGLGGKGANQSVAVAKAGRRAVHIGKVGADRSPVDAMAEFGVVTDHIGLDGSVTGHAVIYVDPDAENMIVVLSGANRELSLSQLEAALGEAKPGDILLLQNEVNLCAEAAKLGRSKGCRVIYSAAPFEADAAAEMLPLIDVLVMNEVEAAQMAAHIGVDVTELDVADMIITRGAKGAAWHGSVEHSQPAFKAEPKDTTGAGDCFIGYVAAALDEGMAVPEALRLASAASAIQVTRNGAGLAMPMRDEVDRFLAQQQK